MAFRFRRSIKLAPGLRLNVGKRGFSVSAGVRGASVTLGQRGVYANVGLPGSGISYRTKLNGPLATSPASTRRGAAPSVSRALPASASSPLDIRIGLREDGTVGILTADGAPLPPRLVRRIREEHGARIEEWLHEQCDHWNQGVDELLRLHLGAPAAPLHFTPEPFAVPEPAQPQIRRIGLLARLFPWRRRAIEEENAAAEARYREAVEQWRAAAAEHARGQDARRELFDRARRGETDAMTQLLEERLASIQWPRETSVSFELSEDGRTAFLDVDLPEIEDMPTHQAEVAARGLRIKIKERSDTQRRREYMTHIHAIGFRVLAEAFAALPTLERVVFSGYSQRPDRATGQVRDDYLISAVVTRSVWSDIDLTNLDAVDPVAAFERFDLRRKMTKTGVFSPIEPFGREA